MGLCFPVAARIDTRSVRLPTEKPAGMPWMYVSKFGFKIGSDATVRGKVSGLLPAAVATARKYVPSPGGDESGEYDLSEISSPE
eukprot:COSAG05_NODE_5605_length_1132_cov_1.723136_1_plen_84_part_00